MKDNEHGLPFILLAEDDDNDALGLELAFRKAECSDQVRRVSDGQQAIDYLAGHGEYADRSKHPLPSLLLMDWKMPGKSGLEVLKWVRAHPFQQHLVVVILSGSADDADKKLAYQFGANSYLMKPGNFVDFVKLLDHLANYWKFNLLPNQSGPVQISPGVHPNLMPHPPSARQFT